MTSVQDGAFYGWPWSYYGAHVDRRVHPVRQDMVDRAVAPDYALSSHVAALGMAFSDGSALPEPYASGAFVGEHGSWNRTQFNGYKVVFVPFVDGRPEGMAQDVVTGFLDGDRARGRPVGLGIDGTGALLVADDAGNTVWRVAAADGSVTEAPVPTDGVPTGEAAAAAEPSSDPAAAPDSPAEAGAAAPAAEEEAGRPEPSPLEVAPATQPPEPREGAAP